MSEDLKLIIGELVAGQKFIIQSLEKSEAHNEKQDKKYDVMLSQISQNELSGERRYIQLKTSVKNQVGRLEVKHDADMKKVSWVMWLHAHPKTFSFIAFMLLLSCLPSLVWAWENRSAIKEVMLYLPFL